MPLHAIATRSIVIDVIDKHGCRFGYDYRNGGVYACVYGCIYDFASA